MAVHGDRIGGAGNLRALDDYNAPAARWMTCAGGRRMAARPLSFNASPAFSLRVLDADFLLSSRTDPPAGAAGGAAAVRAGSRRGHGAGPCASRPAGGQAGAAPRAASGDHGG